MSTPSHPNMRAVAAHAHVALSTVSKALRNDPALPPTTCRRIQEVAETLGYRRNPLVSALMTQVREGRTHPVRDVLVGLDLWPGGWEQLKSATYRRFFRGAFVRAEELGYRLETLRLPPGKDALSRLARRLRCRGIDGVWVPPLPPGCEAIEWDFADFSVSSVGFTLSQPRVHRSAPHYYQHMDLALQKLRRRGYRRIGFAITEEVDRKLACAWRAEFLARTADYDSALRIPLHRNSNRDFRAFQSWIRRWQPDALLCLETWIFLPWLDALGVRCPVDIGILHLGSNERLPRIAGIDQNAEAVGSASIDLLVGQLNRNERGLPSHPKTVLIEGQWIEGASLPNRTVGPTDYKL